MKLQELVLETKKPSGTFAEMLFDESDLKKIQKWIKTNKIPNRISHKKMHCTLLYSKKHCPNYEPAGDLDPPLEAKPKKLEIWPSESNGTRVLVMTLDAPKIVDRHKELMDAHDATYDFDEYKPHLTLSYDVGKEFSTENLPNIQDEIPCIRAVKENGADLIEDWTKK